jgi:hypothetical protein
MSLTEYQRMTKLVARDQPSKEGDLNSGLAPKRPETAGLLRQKQKSEDPTYTILKTPIDKRRNQRGESAHQNMQNDQFVSSEIIVDDNKASPHLLNTNS